MQLIQYVVSCYNRSGLKGTFQSIKDIYGGTYKDYVTRLQHELAAMSRDLEMKSLLVDVRVRCACKVLPIMR